MVVAEQLRQDWKDDLGALFADVRERLVVSSPYVTPRGADFMLSNLSDAIKPRIRLSLLTDLSPINVAQAATDPEAIQAITAAVPNTRVTHLPRVHAKVYVQDSRIAIVTSGNLTAGGLDFNYEYGLKVLDGPTAAEIDRDVEEYAILGAFVPTSVLSQYSQTASELRELYLTHEKALRRTDRRLQSALSTATDQLIRLRLAGGAMHTVFAATILYLLTKYGLLPTTELHPRIAAIHPDLCDNSVDRITEGKSYGKKWKHAVRTAQQQLKTRGSVRLVGEWWTLVE